MALAYVVHVEPNNGAAGVDGAVSTASRTYNAGEMVTIVHVCATASSSTTFSIANTNTAQTWVPIRAQVPGTGSNCGLAAWYCVMSTTQAMVVTSQTPGVDVNAHSFVIIETGQHATDPRPDANDFGASTTTDASQAITPTSTGSDLWFAAGDWSQTNTFAAIANCTSITGIDLSGEYTSVLIRPTTQPRTDANAFTIGETDSSANISWIAWEVQAAASAPAGKPRTGFTLLGVG